MEKNTQHGSLQALKEQSRYQDLLELILKARGIWDAIVEEYTEEGKEDRQ